ncbi:MAG: chemotaxis protein [Desulfovibrionaceae bacterium]
MTKSEILLETGTNELEILEFYINEAGPDGKTEPCHFGMNVAKVMQVIESPELTPSDSAPHPCYMGIIPLRGHILPVLDLAIWLDMEREKNEFDVVVVTEFSQTVTGFLVSGVVEIHRLGWEEVIPPGEYVSRMGAHSIIGMVNKGDRFIQLLDLESILTDLDPHAMEGFKVDVRAGGKGYKALVADDSATIRYMLQNNLEDAGFQVVMASNGSEALEKLKTIKGEARAAGQPVTDLLHVVISDIEMPLMDGFSMTKHVKTDEELGKLPVILYSSIITKELRHKGEAVRADEQVSKPEMNRMAEIAVRLIEERRAVAEETHVDG